MREQTARSLALPAAKFKRKLGVKRKTFEAMMEVLYQREAHKKKQGRPPALCLEDQLVLALSFWREYRTHFHLVEDWGVDESTVRRSIERLEDALIKSGKFSLPGRKALRDEHDLEVVIVDIAESAVERPKKTAGLLLGQTEISHPQKPGHRPAQQQAHPQHIVRQRTRA
jgi:hypothetical protein